MAAKKTKQQNSAYVDQNPVEAFRDLGGGIVKSVVSDVGKGSITGLWEQLLGTETNPKKKHLSGDLSEGQEVDIKSLASKKTEKAPNSYIDPGIDYRRDVLRHQERSGYEQSKETKMLIQQILVEIKKLASSTKELEVTYKEVVVEQRIEKPGKYHLTFFEWMLSVIQNARMRVEESSSWLAMFASKKKQKQYWNMFKKYNTTFGLSNERVVATQTG